MHQPYYKDDLQNTFLLPWVRLRCAKDYYKMPALLDGYPSIKQTFNLVPALVAQIEDYVDGRFADVYLDLARRPVSELTTDERAFIARWMTESSQIRRVRQYPRYLDLTRKREQAWPRAADDLAKLVSRPGHRPRGAARPGHAAPTVCAPGGCRGAVAPRRRGPYPSLRDSASRHLAARGGGLGRRGPARRRSGTRMDAER